MQFLTSFREAKKETEPDNFNFWSLYGYVLFLQALGISSAREKESYIAGSGLTQILILPYLKRQRRNIRRLMIFY